MSAPIYFIKQNVCIIVYLILLFYHRGVFTTVGQSNCIPPVPRAFNSRHFLSFLRQSLLTAIGHFGISAISPCYIWKYFEWKTVSYTASEYGQLHDNNNVYYELLIFNNCKYRKTFWREKLWRISHQKLLASKFLLVCFIVNVMGHC